MNKVIVALACILTLSACGGTANEPKAAPPSQPLPPPTSATPLARAPAIPTASPRPATIRVPNVVGENHQAAQNTMQAAGLYALAEEDATGENRVLLWDRNWVVVRQTPKGGAKVAADTTITLYSKKIGE